MSDALTFHKTFTADDFDAQYNLRLGRPDFESTVMPDWQMRSEVARTDLNCQLDIRYGNGQKQKLDVFPCDDRNAPTLIYFHGGYWHRGDKSLYSFLAQPFVANGANVVVVGYDLCPVITITDICAQARQAIAYLWRNASDLGLNRNRLSVMGHSAGGHIAQMMMGTDWSAMGTDLPQELIAAGIPVSPLSYLEPVRLTEALNSEIRMTAEEADLQSPMTHHPPATNAPQVLVVGGAETREFHRQAQMYVDAFNSNSRSIELFVVPNVDHFDELNVLADTQSPVFQKVHGLINTAGIQE